MSIDELETYFKSKELPKTIKLHNSIIIKDVPKFIESHLSVIKNYGDRPAFKSFYKRLMELKELLEQ